MLIAVVDASTMALTLMAVGCVVLVVVLGFATVETGRTGDDVERQRP